MNHVRHSSIFDASKTNITLVGAGGIGAAAGLTLAKMGVPYLEVWDDDVVSEENLATQFHRLSDIGRPKVEAFAEMVAQFSDDTTVVPIPERVEAHAQVGGDIVISAVDSIHARKTIWEAIHDHDGNPNFQWYIDSRMAAEEAQLFVVGERDTAWYREYIDSIDESMFPDVACTEKATIFCSAGIGALIGAVVRKIVSNQEIPRIVTYDWRSFAGLKLLENK